MTRTTAPSLTPMYVNVKVAHSNIHPNKEFVIYTTRNRRELLQAAETVPLNYYINTKKGLIVYFAVCSPKNTLSVLLKVLFYDIKVFVSLILYRVS